MKHPHADAMMQYAQDAMETDKPYERWEFINNNVADWSGLGNQPAWDCNTKYRRKPKPYEPTLLDQALELEIEALRLRINHYVDSPATVQVYRGFLDRVKAQRSPEMIEHLKQQGKL